MAVRRNTHIHVEFLYRYLPAEVGRALSTFVDVVRIAFLAYASWLSFQLVPQDAQHEDDRRRRADERTSTAWSPLGFAMMTFRVDRRWRSGTGSRAGACSSDPARSEA